MGHPRRYAYAVLAIFMVALAHSARATALDAGDQPTVVVRLDNDAGIAADNVQFAQDRAAAVFGKIGARVIWVDVNAAIRDSLSPPFTIVLVRAEQPAGPATLREDPLGLARPQVHRAYVFYDRLAELNLLSPRSIPSILGDVLAHELGHLLLSSPHHSRTGIMRAGVNINAWAVDTFTESQAREILSRLRETP